MRRTRLFLAVAVAASAVVVGLPPTASAHPAAPPAKADIPVQLLAMNDFHGRISAAPGTDRDAQLLVDPGPDGVYGDPNPDDKISADDTVETVGGSAYVAATVARAKKAFVAAGGTEKGSLFVGAGDLVSASTFESSVFKDEPTIEVLDAMGLDVSAVGNHEFDRGTDELRRISGATDGTYTDDVEACEGIVPGETGCFGEAGHEFDGADFPYLAANVLSKESGRPMLPPYQIFDVGGGKKMALIGVVTDTTPTIVSPAGIEDVRFIDEAQAVNRYVPELQRKGIQAIGVLVHEGGTNTGTDPLDRNGCDRLSGPVVDINNAVSPAVDLIVSAHSHQAYNCMLTDKAGQPRLVTQAGFYGRLVTDIRLSVDRKTGDVNRLCADYRADNLPVTRYEADGTVSSIVAYWNGRADEEGSRPTGSTTDTIGGRSDRTTESPIGDLVAESQLEGAKADQSLQNPVVAFMNPGGVRADLPTGPLTFRQAFAVQPFGNTVNAITLTGADIRAVLEQQFQQDQARGTRLMLGTSANFGYQYDLTRPYGDRVDPASITLDVDGAGPGAPAVIDPAATYRVAANSFLIAGGDEFTAFRRGVDPVTGPVDVDTFVDYLLAHSPVAPPAVGHGQAVASDREPDPANVTSTPPAPPTTVDAVSGLNGPATPGPGCDATATVSKATARPGDRLTVTGSKFGKGEKVTAVLVKGSRTLGSAKADSRGTAAIAFTVPRSLAVGQYQVRLTGSSGETATTVFTVRTTR